MKAVESGSRLYKTQEKKKEGITKPYWKARLQIKLAKGELSLNYFVTASAH
jgi:hypothetical protein